MVALNTSGIELMDLIEVEIPWSVPTASKIRFYFHFKYLLRYWKMCLYLKVLFWIIEHSYSTLHLYLNSSYGFIVVSTYDIRIWSQVK